MFSGSRRPESWTVRTFFYGERRIGKLWAFSGTLERAGSLRREPEDGKERKHKERDGVFRTEPMCKIDHLGTVRG